jgi:hypothetical protein
MRSNHNDRLFDRNQQTLGWAAPLPDFSTMPRANEANRVRMEWETRDTANNRFYEQTQNMGPTAVTAAMLRDHPTHGAEPFMPSTGRQDARPYQATATPKFFPDTMDPIHRPRLPPRSMWAHPYLDDVDVEDPNVTREFRHSVMEENRGRFEDISVRGAQRAFAHQWGPQISLDQLAAAERLRPQSDDYRVSYAHMMEQGAAPGSLGGPTGGDLQVDPNAARLYPEVIAHDRMAPGFSAYPVGTAQSGGLTQATASRMYSGR